MFFFSHCFHSLENGFWFGLSYVLLLLCLVTDLTLWLVNGVLFNCENRLNFGYEMLRVQPMFCRCVSQKISVVFICTAEASPYLIVLSDFGLQLRVDAVAGENLEEGSKGDVRSSRSDLWGKTEKQRVVFVSLKEWELSNLMQKKDCK